MSVRCDRIGSFGHQVLRAIRGHGFDAEASTRIDAVVVHALRVSRIERAGVAEHGGSLDGRRPRTVAVQSGTCLLSINDGGRLPLIVGKKPHA
jgi:hypothetical protein